MSTEQKTLSGNIALSRLKHAIVTTKKGAKCLMIPIEENALVENKYVSNGKEIVEYEMPIRIIYKPIQDDRKQNGFVAKSTGSEFYKENKDKEELMKSVTPILGNIKDWSNSQPEPVNNDMGGGQEFTEEDDLPF